VNFVLEHEHQQLKELAARFVREELITLERRLLEREATGDDLELNAGERSKLDARARELGLWALDAPSEFGGSELPLVAMVGVNEELGRTAIPYEFPPDSPNLHMLAKTANSQQREAYLGPYARGETVSAMAISEPGAGGDPAGMKTSAKREGDSWVLNGRKIWVSRMNRADFAIVMAVTDKAKGSRGGISAFIVPAGTKGFIIERRIRMIGGHSTFELVFDDCRIPADGLLGEEGKGFGPMQGRLSSRRVQIAAWAVGTAQRALDMMLEHVPHRVTFGAPLSERQAVQWWIADAAMKIHATRLMTYEAAAQIDRGGEARTEVSMIKVFGSEMATEVVDHAMQAFGAMGMSKEMPLHVLAARARKMRIYEGPSEVHRMVIARNLLRGR